MPAADSPSDLEEQLEQLQRRISDVQAQRQTQQAELAGIDNQALRHRFGAMVDDLARMEADYQRQVSCRTAPTHTTTQIQEQSKRAE